ncbi:hypothetical protein ARMSODRAFT_472608 [Armillaria solidipes]|uniref:Uncharacterized protein n=1 Tax=Armillaria solidipes TaxID=1076256 RepID=A0A2H3B5J1_9AGAR|nr:hypothetical protein ARMSODRAFT_472608 [Armillaria solidipes]
MLRHLPETHPSLYKELSSGTLEDSTSGTEEPSDPFANGAPDDDSDIPLEVIVDLVQSRGTDLDQGYVVNAVDGAVVRSTVAEADDASAVSHKKDPEPELKMPVVSKRGRRIKRSTWYGNDDWERF